jgi:hypothetical protein
MENTENHSIFLRFMTDLPKKTIAPIPAGEKVRRRAAAENARGSLRLSGITHISQDVQAWVEEFIEGNISEENVGARILAKHRKVAEILAKRSVTAASECVTQTSEAHQHLDSINWLIANEVVTCFPMGEIRRSCKRNLLLWKEHGIWPIVYQEWYDLLEHGTDLMAYDAILGDSGNSKRLRQSAPYVGMPDKETVNRIHMDGLT